MDAILQAQLNRVETALNTLIDSITSYNASPQAAMDLVAADDELSKRVEQLAVHHANYREILQLRQTAEELENQVKSTLSRLAETRRELLDTPATVYPPSAREVPVDELLAYAKRISKFSAPPGFKPPEIESEKAIEDKTVESNMADGGATHTPDQAEGEKTADTKNSDAVLTEAQKAWLNSASTMTWFPWPTEEKIRMGGLAAIQAMVDQGKDPSKVLTPAEQEAEDKRRAEEEERRKQEDEERDRQRRASLAAAAANRSHTRQEQPAPAYDESLDLYDPDEED